jgi:hypothetical protein
MQDSKLVQLFSKLSGYEQANIKKFLSATFHNRRPDLPKLFEFLQKQTRYKAPDYSKLAAWRYCYGAQKAYKDSDMRGLMSSLLHKIEDYFLVVQTLQADNPNRFVSLDNFYTQKQLPEHLEENLKQWDKLLAQKKSVQDSAYLRHFYTYQKKSYKHKSALQRVEASNLQILTDSLEKQFVAERLQEACSVLASQSLSKTPHQTGMLDLVLDFVQRQHPDWLAIPAIGLYYYFYQSLSQNDPEQSVFFFGLYTRMLFESGAHFSAEELRNFYKMAINYTIRKANTHNNQQEAHEVYNQQLFGLYKTALAQKILIEHGQISRFSYKNMVALGLRLKELAWVEDFIRTYTVYLGDDYKTIYEHYALGKYCFACQDYPQALLHLQKVAYEEIFLGLDARVVQLKIYYETQEWEVLDSHLQSFKMFLLRKKKVLGYHFDIYKQILRFTRRLIQADYVSKRKIQQLREKITTTPTLTEREWLLKMLEGKK